MARTDEHLKDTWDMNDATVFESFNSIGAGSGAKIVRDEEYSHSSLHTTNT